MEELGKVLMEAIRAGRDIAPMAVGGYFLYRILEVIAWPIVWTMVAWAVGRYGIGRFFDVWKSRLEVAVTQAQAALARARADWAQQLLSAELYVERRTKENPEWKPPTWWNDVTTMWPGHEKQWTTRGVS